MITKQQFVEYMSTLQELSKTEDNINKALKGLDSDFNCISFGKYGNLIMTILHDAFNDENDWIEYFVYDQDFGQNARLGDVTTSKGKPIPFKSSEDVYNLLIKNIKSNEKKNVKFK